MEDSAMDKKFTYVKNDKLFYIVRLIDEKTKFVRKKSTTRTRLRHYKSALVSLLRNGGGDLILELKNIKEE